MTKSNAKGSQTPANDQPMPEVFVGFSIDPHPDVIKPEAGVITLVAPDGAGGENKLAAGLGPAQLREAAARMLTIADLIEQGAKKTVMVVTNASAWPPGQVLQIRDTPKGFHYEFLIKSKLAVPETPHLIIPDGVTIQPDQNKG